MNKIRDAFETVKADEALKKSTSVFLHEEIARRQKKPVFRMRYAACAVVMLVLLINGFGFYSIYKVPVSYISVDVNPSIELSLNRLDRVVAATAYNDDGEKILDHLNLRGKTYTAAIDTLLADEDFQKYLTKDAMLTFTVVSDEEEAIVSGIESCSGYRSHHGVCGSAKSDTLQEAHENGMSFGKYKAYQKLQECDSSVTAEECENMTMRQIHDRIAELCGDEESGASHGKGNQAGEEEYTGKGNQSGEEEHSGNGNQIHGEEHSGNGNGNYFGDD